MYYLFKTKDKIIFKKKIKYIYIYILLQSLRLTIKIKYTIEKEIKKYVIILKNTFYLEIIQKVKRNYN